MDSNSTMSNTGSIYFIIISVAGLVLYVLPTIIAFIRKKRNVGAIFMLNILLGWTCLGWFGALIWSLMLDSKPSQIIYIQRDDQDRFNHPM